jgi:hypothetical protein
MRIAVLALSLSVLALVARAQATGLAYNENVSVIAPDQATAELVLAKADRYRRDIAKEWFSEELPPGIGRIAINVTLTVSEDTGLTWAKDSAERKYHRVWLWTSPERAVGSTLRHEIAHCVWATRFPRGLPAWVKEAVASASDDPERVQTRQRILAWFRRMDDWPDLREVLSAPSIASTDTASYTAATSLAEFLLARGDKARFVLFVGAGQEHGWDRALKENYGLASVADLQTAWKEWAKTSPTTSAGESSRSGRVARPERSDGRGEPRGNSAAPFAGPQSMAP